MPKVSIIIPVYKVEKYLHRCVDSVLAQTHTDLEVILVDDGSPDDCGVICEGYAAKDSRVKVIHQKNRGLSGARNTGLAEATGSYISFIDSDDAVAPCFIQVLLDAMENEKAEVAECARMDVYDDTLPVFLQGPFAVKGYDAREAFALLIPNEVFHQTVWNKLYRAQVLQGLTFPEGKLHEDEFYTWQVLCRCRRAVTVDGALYAYYHRQGSIMETFSPKRLDAFQARQERHKYILENRPELTAQSKRSILLPCIFVMQRLLRQKDRKMLTQCAPALQQYYATVRMTKEEKKILVGSEWLWIALADRSVKLCAWVRNVLGLPY